MTICRTRTLTAFSSSSIEQFFSSSLPTPSDDNLPLTITSIIVRATPSRLRFNMASVSPLSPTFHGHIASTQDALLLFEACLSGTLNHVARHPHDHERLSLTKSGNVFIYEEHSSGVKRWTDGIPWSPSRIFGNFRVSCELERSSLLEEKQRASEFSKSSPEISMQDPVSAAVSSFDSQSLNSLSKEAKRALINNLADSYGFKEDGLVKKTVSVTVGGICHHLVSYCTVADVIYSKFTTPTKDARFQHITPRLELMSKQNFRTSVHEGDVIDRIDDRPVYISCL